MTIRSSGTERKRECSDSVATFVVTTVVVRVVVFLVTTVVVCVVGIRGRGYTVATVLLTFLLTTATAFVVVRVVVFLVVPKQGIKKVPLQCYL